MTPEVLLYYMSKFGGLLPHKVSRNEEEKCTEIKVSGLGLFITVIWIFITGCSLIFVVEAGFFDGKMTVVTNTVHEVPFTTSLLSTKFLDLTLLLIELFMSIFCGKGFLQIINNYEVIDQKLQQNEGKKVRGVLHRRDTVVICVLIMYYILVFVRSLVFTFVNKLSRSLFIYSLVQDMLRLSSVTIELQFSLLCYMLYLRLQVMNVCLTKSIKQITDYNSNGQFVVSIGTIKEYNTDLLEMKNFKLWKQMNWCKSICLSLLNQIKEILSSYGLLMIIIVGVTAKNLIVQAFLLCKIYFHVNDNNLLTKGVMHYASLFGLYFIRLNTICQFSYLASVEVQKTYYLLLDLDGLKMNKNISEEVAIFHDQMCCKHNQFDVFGIITLDSSLPFQILTAVLSFIIIFIQNEV